MKLHQQHKVGHRIQYLTSYWVHMVGGDGITIAKRKFFTFLTKYSGSSKSHGIKDLC